MPVYEMPPDRSSVSSSSFTSASIGITPPSEGGDDAEFESYLAKLPCRTFDPDTGDKLEQQRTTPLFSWLVKTQQPHNLDSDLFPQYALLGCRVCRPVDTESSKANFDPRHAATVFLNTNSPWSAFICGSQGSGKSYTLSCMLEDCLAPENMISQVGKLPYPMAGIIFHYDTSSSGAICEAAHLCSMGTPVRVLTSTSNYVRLENSYKSLPGAKEYLSVVPLLLKDKHLDVERMLKLMAFSNEEGRVPLYMEVIYMILRGMATASGGASGFDYRMFKRLLDQSDLTPMQKGPMNLRLGLLESFLDVSGGGKKKKHQHQDIFACEPGTLTVVDLTDPFIDATSACVLFDVCLALFMEHPAEGGKVIALDEAHKFMNSSSAATEFTESLLTVIREQRHKAARVIIATQEPTISPKLLDLCTLTFVHRFTSPEWFRAIRDHLAGAAKASSEEGSSAIFETIVNLDVGESLLFSPSAMLDVVDGRATKLGTRYVRFKTRPRLSDDGGKSVLAHR